MPSRTGRSFTSTPAVWGICPVTMLARPGLHSGDEQYDFSKATPPAASVSMCGVRVRWLP